MKIQVGKNITQVGDPLEKIPLERLFLGISKPKQTFRDRIEQLRMVASIDPIRYRELKKQLPYFVCGSFHPPIRRKAHFAAIRLFVLDLDHLSAHGIDRLDLLGTLRELPEVLMAFTSPSSNGVKVMFRLEENCSDEALFSSFYKLFATRFAQQHHLEEVIDYNTSDVTRACFLSHDPHAFFNAECTPVCMHHFIPELDFEQAEKEVKAAEKVIVQQQQKVDTSGPDAEILERIKNKLDPNRRQPKQKDYYVPPEVDEALGRLAAALQPYEMVIADSAPISYGRKVKVAAGGLWAEINIFYGARGFSVVKTTKTGSNPELAKLAAEVIRQILSEEK